MICWLGYIISFVSGGLAGAFAKRLFFLKDNKIQYLINEITLQEVKSILPVTINGQSYDNVFYKKFILTNKTNKDYPAIDVFYAFDSKSTIINKNHSHPVHGKNCYSYTDRKSNDGLNNEVVYHITNFNRNKTITFEFEIGNITNGDICCNVDNLCGVEVKTINKSQIVQPKVPQTKIVSKIDLNK